MNWKVLEEEELDKKVDNSVPHNPEGQHRPFIPQRSQCYTLTLHLS